MVDKISLYTYNLKIKKMNIKLYKNFRDACEDFNKQFKPGDFLRIVTKTNPMTVLHVFLLTKATYQDNKMQIRVATIFDKDCSTNKLCRELVDSNLVINNFRIEKIESIETFLEDYNNITRKKIESRKEEIKRLKNEIYDININTKHVKSDLNTIKRDVEEYLKIRKR